MKLFFEQNGCRLYSADSYTECPCEPETVDALITDPPAGIGFMGNKWDSAKNRDTWVRTVAAGFRNALRALKPGAHGLVWALPRRSHWTALALEDAGFQVTDIVHHIFGEGWPKNRDLSVAIDKEAKVVRPVIGTKKNTYDGASRSPETHSNPAADSSFGKWGLKSTPHGLPLTAPVTEAAKKWSGWGTALKPSAEHWILVRKAPVEKTLASNLVKHGVGGINIEASKLHSGRWPANTVHDGNVFEDRYAGFFYAAKPGKSERTAGGLVNNDHPTVKSIALMSYLIKLITPPGGQILDIFAGSGSTGVAAVNAGFQFIGLEEKQEYLDIAKVRLSAALRSLQ